MALTLKVDCLETIHSPRYRNVPSPSVSFGHSDVVAAPVNS